MVKIFCILIIFLTYINNFSREEILLDENKGINNYSKFLSYPKIEFEENSQLELLNIKGGKEVNLTFEKVCERHNNFNVTNNKEGFYNVTEKFYKDKNYNLKKIIIFNSIIEYQDYIFNDLDKNNFIYSKSKKNNNLNIKLEDMNKKLNFLYFINKVPRSCYTYTVPKLKFNIIFSDYIVFRTKDFSYIIDLSKKSEILNYNSKLKENDVNEINNIIDILYENKDTEYKNLDKKTQEILHKIKFGKIKGKEDITKLLEKDIIKLFFLLKNKESKN